MFIIYISFKWVALVVFDFACCNFLFSLSSDTLRLSYTCPTLPCPTLLWTLRTWIVKPIAKPRNTTNYHHNLIMHAKARLEVFTDERLPWTIMPYGLALWEIWCGLVKWIITSCGAPVDYKWGLDIFEIWMNGMSSCCCVTGETCTKEFTFE